jgi:transcriptional regulator with XRE-family HTH domain
MILRNGAFSARLKAIRLARGLDQTEFGAIGGVGRAAQSSYEKGDRSPDVDYLLRIGDAGVDVSELLTGIPTVTPVFDAQEIEIIRLLRSCPDEVRGAFATILRRCAEQTTPARSTLHSGASPFVPEGDKR